MDKHLKITFPVKILVEAVEFWLNAEILKHPCEVVRVEFIAMADFVEGDTIDNDDDQSVLCVWEITIEDAGVKVETIHEPVEESSIKVKPVINRTTINCIGDPDAFEQRVKVAVDNALKEIPNY